MRTDQEVRELEATAHPDCATCQRVARDRIGLYPRHEASSTCQSGRRDHCTCDTCF